MTAYLEQNEGPAIVGIGATLIALSTIGVSVRFWSRAVTPDLRFWWDDWALLATWVFTTLFVSFSIWWTTIGLGRHEVAIPKSNISINGVVEQVTLMWYDTATTLLRVSALALYARIFKASKHFRWTLWGSGAIVVIWWILLLIIPFTHCNPPIKLIYPRTPGTCTLNAVSWFLATAFMSAIMDVAILLLPLPMIWRLQLRLQKKLLLCLVFLLGYSSAFVSLARFVIVVRNPKILSPITDPDLTWNLVPNEILALFEPALGLMALCGPSVNHLVQRGRKHGLSSLWSSKTHSALVGSNRTRSGKHSDTGTSNEGSKIGIVGKMRGWQGGRWLDGSHSSLNKTAHAYSSEAFPAGTEIPMHEVLLTKDIHVTRDPAMNVV